MKAKHSLLVSLIVLAIAQTMVSCKYSHTLSVDYDSQIITQPRALEGFERIDIQGSPSVYYSQADSFSVRLEGPEDVVNNIITNVENNTLTIRNKGKIGVVNISISAAGSVKVYVTSPDLVGVQLSGSGDFTSEGRVDTDNMQIVLRGSGDIDFSDIICDNSTCELIGSGNLNIKHLEAQTSTATLVGSGDLLISQWNVGKTDISLRGSGDVEINFNEDCKKVTCNLVGSGDIRLKGRIGSLEQHKSGSGTIDQQL